MQRQLVLSEAIQLSATRLRRGERVAEGRGEIGEDADLGLGNRPTPFPERLPRGRFYQRLRVFCDRALACRLLGGPHNVGELVVADPGP